MHYKGAHNISFSICPMQPTFFDFKRDSLDDLSKFEIEGAIKVFGTTFWIIPNDALNSLTRFFLH